MTVAAVRTPIALLIELIATYAAIAVFVAMFGGGASPSLISVAAVVIGSFVLSRVLQATDLDQPAMRKVGLAASVVAIFVVARLEYAPDQWLWQAGWLRDLVADAGPALRANGATVAGVVGLTAAWLRGLLRAQVPFEPQGVLESASGGLVAVALAAAVAPAARVAPDARWPGSFGVLALLYAALALVTLALWNTPEPRERLRAFASRWGGGFAAISALAGGIALAALALDPGAFGFMRPVGEPLGHAAGTALLWLLAPVFVVIEVVVHGIGWLLGWLIPDSKPLPPAEMPPPPDAKPPERRGDSSFGDVLQWVAAAGAVTGIVAVTIALLWAAFRRFARRPERDPRDRDESIERASSLGADLRSLFATLTRRSPRAGSVVEVRRLYFEMLHRAEDEGLARATALTPLQFAPQLDAHFASAAPSRITAAFAESRYGERAIDPAVVRELRRSWAAAIRADGGAV